MEMDLAGLHLYKPPDVLAGDFKPADYLLWWLPGRSAMIEVKQTQNAGRILLANLLRIGQAATIRRCIANRVPYWLVIYWPRAMLNGRKAEQWSIVDALALPIDDPTFSLTHLEASTIYGVVTNETQLGSMMRLALLGELG